MNRTQKAEAVAEFADRLARAPFVAVADYRGITVEQVDGLRRALEKEGVEYLVIKNTLAKRAIAGTPMEGLGEHLSGMSGWILSGEDPVAAAKALRESGESPTVWHKLRIISRTRQDASRPFPGWRGKSTYVGA